MTAGCSTGSDTTPGKGGGAEYPSSLSQSGINVRPCVDTANRVCAPVGTTATATAAKMICWRDGSVATGRYRSQRWFLVETNQPGGPQGFVHSSFVDHQTSVPNCDTVARVRAVDWALTQVGRTTAPAEYGNGALGGLNWGPGPNRQWQGDCAKLTYIAYARQGVRYPLADAGVQWDRMPSRQSAASGYWPRFGDPVFYDIARPYGHTALYIGGTMVVGTVGVDSDPGPWKPVAIYDLHSRGSYLGYGRVA